MADAKARKAVIKVASSQVRSGGIYTRRASTQGSLRVAGAGRSSTKKARS